MTTSEENDDDKLSICICGGNAVVCIIYADDDSPRYNVLCIGCSSQTPESDNKEIAIAGWNAMIKVLQQTENK